MEIDFLHVCAKLSKLQGLFGQIIFWIEGKKRRQTPLTSPFIHLLVCIKTYIEQCYSSQVLRPLDRKIKFCFFYVLLLDTVVLVSFSNNLVHQNVQPTSIRAYSKFPSKV